MELCQTVVEISYPLDPHNILVNSNKTLFPKPELATTDGVGGTFPVTFRRILKIAKKKKEDY
jgi:hypothetical protein